MKKYEDFVNTLPTKALLKLEEERMIYKHPAFLAFSKDDDWDIAYFKISDTEACAVVVGDKDTILNEVVSRKGGSPYTVRMVYVLQYNNSYRTIKVPDTIWSICGVENFKWNYEYTPFHFNNNPYFTDEERWLFSKDGKDLIYGCYIADVGSELKDIETIHCLTRSNPDAVHTLHIPASVKKINRIDGKFSDVTFDGTLPEIAEKAFENAEFDNVAVLTPKSESSVESIAALMRVPLIYSKKCERRRRSEEYILFAKHEPTGAIPKGKGYIALTNANFECDGDPIFINTKWIATYCPKIYRKSDGYVNGSVVLIGLCEGKQEQCAVKYAVYETPEDIEWKIVAVQMRDMECAKV